LLSQSDCRELGLNYGGELEEYRIWAYLEKYGWHGRIEHIGVRNKTKFLADKSFIPCAVITDEEKRIQKYPDYQLFRGDPFSILFAPRVTVRK
jgi:hypothetical protein